MRGVKPLLIQSRQTEVLQYDIHNLDQKNDSVKIQQGGRNRQFSVLK